MLYMGNSFLSRFFGVIITLLQSVNNSKRLILVEEIIRSDFTILRPHFVGESLEFIGSMGLAGVGGVFKDGLANECRIWCRNLFSRFLSDIFLGSEILKITSKTYILFRW